MEASHELRERAARCLRLSRSNLSRDDVALLETRAAALIRDAEQSESADLIAKSELFGVDLRGLFPAAPDQLH